MTRASASIFSIAICIIAVFATAANAQPSIAPIDDALRSAIARGDVPGVVALVTDRRGVLYRGAFGVADVESKRCEHVPADAEKRQPACVSFG